MFSFSKSEEIEIWLREQWAGLFRELLKQRSQQKQLSTLNIQVGELQAINTTLKNYLEEVLSKVNPDTSAQIIRAEEGKLREERIYNALEENHFFNFLMMVIDDKQVARKIIEEPQNETELFDLIDKNLDDKGNRRLLNVLENSKGAREDYNEARLIIGIKMIIFEEDRLNEEKEGSPVVRKPRPKPKPK